MLRTRSTSVVLFTLGSIALVAGAVYSPTVPRPDREPGDVPSAFLALDSQSGAFESDKAVSVSGSVEGQLVYSNTLGSTAIAPSVAGARIADDIVTTARDSCTLDRFTFQVTGDTTNDPKVDQGSFTVDYALYELCPGATPCPPETPDCALPISGTVGSVTLPDEGTHEVTVAMPPFLCSGGINDGQVCIEDVDCHPTCVGGIHEGTPCTAETDCLPSCVGGSADGTPCDSADDCPEGSCNLDDVGTCDVAQVGVCANDDAVLLPSSFYLGVKFDREHAGVDLPPSVVPLVMLVRGLRVPQAAGGAKPSVAERSPP